LPSLLQNCIKETPFENWRLCNVINFENVFMNWLLLKPGFTWRSYYAKCIILCKYYVKWNEILLVLHKEKRSKLIFISTGHVSCYKLSWRGDMLKWMFALREFFIFLFRFQRVIIYVRASVTNVNALCLFLIIYPQKTLFLFIKGITIFYYKTLTINTQ